jgi:ribosomal protein L29
MAILKIEEIKKMSEKEREDKIKDLKLEIIKSKIASSKSKVKIKEIKKTIARLLTLNKLNNKNNK